MGIRNQTVSEAIDMYKRLIVLILCIFVYAPLSSAETVIDGQVTSIGIAIVDSTIENTPIGAITPADGSFTKLTV